jgi:transcription elongation factor GreA
MDRIPMTPRGYEQAVKKLHWLKNVEQPRLQKALGDAREMGDLSENAEYDAAREELWKVDQMIGEFETKVALAEVIDPSKVKKDVVAIGADVKVEDVDRKARDQFVLVGEGETRDDVDCVSISSPLGQALLGHVVGDVVEVQAPRGLIRYKIVAFKYGS